MQEAIDGGRNSASRIANRFLVQFVCINPKVSAMALGISERSMDSFVRNYFHVQIIRSQTNNAKVAGINLNMSTLFTVFQESVDLKTYRVDSPKTTFAKVNLSKRAFPKLSKGMRVFENQ